MTPPEPVTHGDRASSRNRCLLGEPDDNETHGTTEERAEMSPDTNLDFNHLLLIGAGPGMGTAIARRFGREGYRITLLSRGNKLEQTASALREEGFPVQTVLTDVAHLDTHRSILESLYAAPGAPGVLVYNAAMVVHDDILASSVEHLETAYAVDVVGGIVAAQVAAPVMRAAGGGTILFTGGPFADYPDPANGESFAREGGPSLRRHAHRSRGGRRRRPCCQRDDSRRNSPGHRLRP